MGIIEYQLILAHLGSYRLYARVLAGSGLNLAQLDAEAPQLYLCINSSQAQQLIFLIVPCQIAGMVHLLARQIWAVGEFLGGKLRTVQIAFRNLRTRKAQLTDHPSGQEPALSITD